MPRLIEVTTTCDSQEKAVALANRIIEARLAACVQVSGPITSVYRWQDAINCDAEWVCTMKSVERLADELLAFVEEHHSYEVPQLLVLPVLKASEKYARWIEGEVRS